MNRNFIVLAVAVNILTIGLGGFIEYSDLYLREYTSLYQHEVKLTEVEYLPLMYRPTYDYYYGSSIQESEHIISKGSWSLDFFQLSIVIMVIANLAWISFERKPKKGKFCKNTKVTSPSCKEQHCCYVLGLDKVPIPK